jgi:hypothetical protein
MKLSKKLGKEVKKMKDQREKKNKHGINPLVVGAAGIAVGAGVATALADKKTKEKLGKVMGDIRNKVSEYMEKEDVEPKAKRKVAEVKKAVKTAGRRKASN